MILPVAPYATYTYAEPQYLPISLWQPGLRVLVPVGASTRLGVLSAYLSILPSDMPKDISVKELLWPVDTVSFLPEHLLHLIAELSARQMVEPGRVLEAILPAGIRSVSISFKVYDPAFPPSLTPKALKGMKKTELKALASLWHEGKMQVAAKRKYDKEKQYCFLTQDPPWPLRPTAKRQLKICEFLFENGPVPRFFLLKELGPGAGSALNKLIAHGIIKIGEAPEYFSPLPAETEQSSRVPALTAEQKKALTTLIREFINPLSRTALIYGVTGSGKTLVYLKLAEAVLKTGQSVLLLAPEVALAYALYHNVEKHFSSFPVSLYHGYQSPAKKEQIFKDVATANTPQIIVGTRSALFLPVKKPGLIILDEEHDSSFTQDERLPYRAKEVAHFLVQQTKGLLVLGSATPDVKTFYAAQKGHIARVAMPNRIKGQAMPPVHLVCPPKTGPFSQEVATALKETVFRGEQAIIMLNRRGYTPTLYCLSCGLVARCRHCDVGLTYHKARERLICHYCGNSEPFPRICRCGGGKYLPLGEGTENLEEYLAHFLPTGAGVLRLDRDSTRRPGRAEEILAKFAAGQAQVLVGTQMLSKGHHFPEVTLVVAVEADLGLNFPDYRAAERMFQLMVQVSGRAGRGDKPGQVFIQTQLPEHYCWQHVKDVDYDGFFLKEAELRKKYAYPPFVCLALIRITYPANFEKGQELIKEIHHFLRHAGKKENVRVLGPAPAPIALLRGRTRYQCLLKSANWPAIRKLYGMFFSRFTTHQKLRISLDLDPIDML